MRSIGTIRRIMAIVLNGKALNLIWTQFAEKVDFAKHFFIQNALQSADAAINSSEPVNGVESTN